MAEGDYPGGRTPWESYDVPQLAGHLTENLGRAWGQARAWHNAADTTAGYLDALRRVRADLVAVWPPGRSPAAEAYVGRVGSPVAAAGGVAGATGGGRAWGQARAWHNAADTTAGYLDALRRLRANLVAVWPPDRSPAAKAYVERLDSLIASVDDVRDATAGTGEALAGVLSSLEGARPQMDQWRDEWGPQEDTAPNALDGTSDQSRRLELNQKAQQHMRELDDAVFPYQSRMRAPQPWAPAFDDPHDISGGSGRPPGGAGDGGTSTDHGSVRPPDIPPVPPLADDGAGPGPARG